MARKHLIEVLGADGRSEFFTGWADLDAMTGPDFTTERDYATKYDLTFHRDEVLADYERLCDLGFDASIETIMVPDWGRKEPPALAEPVMSPLFQQVSAICAADRARVLALRGEVPALRSAVETTTHHTGR